jgi:ABC-2 type transport system permease protein
MSTILILTKKEVAVYFDSLMAYILLVLFLGFSGFFTWLYGSDIFFSGQASLLVFFNWAYWILFFFIPGLTMRSLAEEKNTGTIEMLSTKAISDWQIICGKFFAVWFLVIAALFLTLPYYFTIITLGDVDHGSILGGYLALVLYSATLISIGIFASSITENQIVAFLLTLLIALFFQIIFQILAMQISGWMALTLYYLSFNTHFQSLIRGVIDSRDLIFFLTFIVLGLMFAKHVLSKRLQIIR